MTNLPFTEKIINGMLIREFKENTTAAELVWHRDRENRKVTVLEGKEWLLQLDNQVPVVMQEGTTYEIPKHTYHRIIKGSGSLVVEIKKEENTMKVTKNQLRRIIREVANPAAREIAVEVMEDTLNNLWQEGFNNADLIAILDQLKLDIERGFIGEPS